jgi:cytochrome b6-f complex iron-sulfur subunit
MSSNEQERPATGGDGRMTRRAMLVRAGGGALGGAAAAAGLHQAHADAASASSVASGVSRSTHLAPGRFAVGALEAFAPGTRIAIDPLRICVVRDGNRVAALSTTCTHLGCIVGLVEGGFACPCHGSRYDRYGAVTGGPAPAPLTWFAVRLMPGGELEVDTTVVVAPGTFLSVAPSEP